MECKICGKSFDLTDGEIQFYRDRALELPKRCPSCRASKRRDSKQLAELKARIKELEEKNGKENVDKGIHR